MVNQLSKLKLPFLTIMINIIVLSLASSSINAQASPIIKEYDVSDYYKTDKLYEFKVKLVIEAEEDGTWKTHNSYKVDFFISVTFINYSYFDALVFGNATVWMVNGVTELLWLSRVGWIEIDSLRFNEHMGEFIAYSPSAEGRVELCPSIEVHSRGVHRGLIVSTRWGGLDEVEPIYITVKSSSSDSHATLPIEYFYIAMGALVVLILILIIVLFYYRKSKTNQKSVLMRNNVKIL